MSMYDSPNVTRMEMRLQNYVHSTAKDRFQQTYFEGLDLQCMGGLLAF